MGFMRRIVQAFGVRAEGCARARILFYLTFRRTTPGRRRREEHNVLIRKTGRAPGHMTVDGEHLGGEHVEIDVMDMRIVIRPGRDTGNPDRWDTRVIEVDVAAGTRYRVWVNAHMVVDGFAEPDEDPRVAAAVAEFSGGIVTPMVELAREVAATEYDDATGEPMWGDE